MSRLPQCIRKHQHHISADRGFNFPLMLPVFQSKTALLKITSSKIKQSNRTQYSTFTCAGLWHHTEWAFRSRCAVYDVDVFHAEQSHSEPCVWTWQEVRFSPADILSVSHQHGASGSAGLRRDLDLSSVYRSSISLVPFLPLTVRLMMCWVKPKGRAAPGTVQSRNWGESSSSPCLKMKKQKALI